MRRILLALTATAALLGCATQAQDTAAQQAAPQAQQTTPPTAPTAPTVTAGASRVIMLRVYVADMNRAVNFYQAVFGATAGQGLGNMGGANRGANAGTGGGNVRMLNLPGGALPGLILIQSPDAETMNGSWIMQVPNLQAALDAAAANGGRLMNTDFNAPQAGMAARSSHIVDPDGNIIEVLQLGGAR